MPFPSTPSFHSVANVDAVVTAKNVRFTVLTDRLIRLEYRMVIISKTAHHWSFGIVTSQYLFQEKRSRIILSKSKQIICI